MTDKDKIRAEVERLLNKEWKWQSSTEGKYRCETYRELLEFIDSMPKEPVNNDLDEAAKQYIEPFREVSECDEDYSCTPTDTLSASIMHIGQSSFSKCTSAFIDGANWQKQQMMKDAVEGVVTLDYWDAEDREIDVVLADNVIGEEHGIKDGDKVKLIIIKED